MGTFWLERSPRRLFLAKLPVAAGALVLGRSVAAGSHAAAQADLMTVSGGGVNLKPMPSPDGKGTVPLRELFALDTHYAQCVIEDNPARFAMDTFAMGRVVIEPHTFFMAMYANDVTLVGVYDAGGGKLLARLTGSLGCSTEAGTASGKVGSRTATEPAFFDIEAVDGGHGGGAAGDRFAFTVSFDAKQAPVNHAIFGDKATFTGEMTAGEITIAAPVALPLLPGTPTASTPTA
jgi:hypothetical protein